MEWNKIICGDALQEMKKLPDEAFDTIITSPPYNIRNSTGGFWRHPQGIWKAKKLSSGYDAFDDCMPEREYIAWQRECLKEMMRLIPDHGAIFYVHKWRVQNGQIQDRREIISGFPLRQIIIWKRDGGVNFNLGYFLPTYEVIYMITKPKFKLTKKGVVMGDVWHVRQDQSNSHPAPFPIGIPMRILIATNAESVLDPFVGSGTTCVAAKMLNRKFLGIEQSERYYMMATKRLEKTPVISTNESFQLELFDSKN